MRIITLLILFSTALYSQNAHKLVLKDFKPTKLEMVSLGLGIADGVSRGILEALHANPKALETKFNLNPYQFGGSQDWQRNYYTNRYRNSDGSINKHKPEYLGNFGRDAWHTFGDISKISGRLETLSFGVSATIQFKNKKKVLPIVLKGLLIYSVSSLTERITYNYLR